MNDIKIFKTNVTRLQKANDIIRYLAKVVEHCQINFDLEDCDHILRVEGKHIPAKKVIDSLNELGYHCIELH